MRSKIIVALTLASTVLLAAAPASAQRWHGRAGNWHGGSNWHGGGWRGPGAGFVAGALIGGALAAPYAYGYPVYNEPAYAEVPVEGDAVSYCMSRYRSYDPASGTFLGYDGLRHPCP
jgi:hypothetical protein